MATYHCKGFRLISQQVECDIEANSPEEAEEKAFEMFGEEDCDYENDFTNKPEVSGDIEVEEINSGEEEDQEDEDEYGDELEDDDFDEEDQDEYEEE